MGYVTNHGEFFHQGGIAAILLRVTSPVSRVVQDMVSGWADGADEREEAQFISRSGGQLTDSVEREMMERKISGWRSFGS